MKEGEVNGIFSIVLVYLEWSFPFEIIPNLLSAQKS